MDKWPLSKILITKKTQKTSFGECHFKTRSPLLRWTIKTKLTLKTVSLFNSPSKVIESRAAYRLTRSSTLTTTAKWALTHQLYVRVKNLLLFDLYMNFNHFRIILDQLLY